MIEDSTIFRNKEQVLYDLSKALGFSPDSLEANRKGKLSKDQIKRLAPQCTKPPLLALIFLVAPFAVWTWITAGRAQLPLQSALLALFTELAHPNDLFEAHGKMSGVLMYVSIIVSLGIAALIATRVSPALWFDLLDRKVEAREGRVVAREEQINRPNGRDPIEKYFFSLRYLNMPVNLAAYRALEAGSPYIVYLTLRSEILVSIEPKMDDVPAAAAPGPASHHKQAPSTSPSGRAV